MTDVWAEYDAYLVLRAQTVEARARFTAADDAHTAAWLELLKLRLARQATPHATAHRFIRLAYGLDDARTAYDYALRIEVEAETRLVAAVLDASEPTDPVP